MNASRFIACGMYAPDDAVKSAWQVLFNYFYPLVDTSGELQRHIVFGSDESVLRDRNLFIGHTCGYPLMTQLQAALLPVCVPCFDVAGAAGKLYSSPIIVPADSDIEAIEQCRGKIVAINSIHSNSGMNVLRHALAKLGAVPGFFSEVLMSGEHQASLEAVAANRAQLAAIDCVTFQLIADRDPDLVSAVRIIGYSEQTCGLPFVMPRNQYSKQQCESIVSALNLALANATAEVKRMLHLDRFEAVTMDDYQSILELEKFALDAGYAQLN